MGFKFTSEAKRAVEAYLAHKPKGKFGAHFYSVDRQDSTQKLFERYQDRFNVPSEE